MTINELSLVLDGQFLRPDWKLKKKAPTQIYVSWEAKRDEPTGIGLKKIEGQPAENAVHIPASFEFDNLNLWSKVDLTSKQDEVEEVLQIIEPRLVRLSIANKIPRVRLKNEEAPRPLKNFGEGMNRLLTIALGLVNAENKILLIDEIDLGLHHSIQDKLWEIVFSTAKKLNVQVFATTHSRDCVEAFSTVSQNYGDMGNYFRLQKNRDSDGFRAVNYDAEMLESAVEQEMETR